MDLLEFEMGKRLELSGKKFGRLTVIRYLYSHIQPSRQKRAMWECKCDCGTVKAVSTSALTTIPGTKSCGCYLNEIRKAGINKKEKGEANLNYKFLSYRTRARNKGMDFSLDKDKFREIILNTCFYCGSKPSMVHTRRSENGVFVSNGIDRINSDVGYTESNSVPCCRLCNMMKNKLSVNQFLEHIEKIYNKGVISKSKNRLQVF